MKFASCFTVVLKKMRSYPLSLKWLALSQAHRKKKSVYMCPCLKSLTRFGFVSTSEHGETQSLCIHLNRWRRKLESATDALDVCFVNVHISSASTRRSYLSPCDHLMQVFSEAGGFSPVTQDTMNLAPRDGNAKESWFVFFFLAVLAYFEEGSEKHIRKVPKFRLLINLCLVACACDTGNK